MGSQDPSHVNTVNGYHESFNEYVLSHGKRFFGDNTKWFYDTLLLIGKANKEARRKLLDEAEAYEEIDIESLIKDIAMDVPKVLKTIVSHYIDEIDKSDIYKALLGAVPSAKTEEARRDIFAAIGFAVKEGAERDESPPDLDELFSKAVVEGCAKHLASIVDSVSGVCGKVRERAIHSLLLCPSPILPAPLPSQQEIIVALADALRVVDDEEKASSRSFPRSRALPFSPLRRTSRRGRPDTLRCLLGLLRSASAPGLLRSASAFQGLLRSASAFEEEALRFGGHRSASAFEEEALRFGGHRRQLGRGRQRGQRRHLRRRRRQDLPPVGALRAQ